MSDGMRRELAYLSSHATNRYFIPNWGIYIALINALKVRMCVRKNKKNYMLCNTKKCLCCAINC